MIWLATLWSGISLRTKALTALGILFCLAVFMMAKTSRDAGKREALDKVEAASDKATVEALERQIEASINSDVRRDAESEKAAIIQGEIDNAKANGTDPVVGYFDGLRKANSGGAGQPAD